MDERKMEEKFAQKTASNEKAISDRGRVLVDALLEIQKSGDLRHCLSEARRARGQSTKLLIGWVALSFTFGVLVGSAFEQMKDTPHVMHHQEATHGQ